jgi:hypothetical protein
MQSPSSGSKKKASKKRARCAYCLNHASYLLGLFFDAQNGDGMFLLNVGLNFNGLHGVISQMTEPFITTAVRSSNPTVL